jgi:hypothetical protein
MAPASNASSTASFEFETFVDVANDEKIRLYQKLLTKKSRFQDELAVITDQLEASNLTGAGVKCLFEMKYHEERIGLQATIEGLQATIEGLQATIEGLQATVECLDARNVRYEKTIASLMERVTNLEQNRQSGVASTTGSSSARGSTTRSRNRSAHP